MGEEPDYGQRKIQAENYYAGVHRVFSPALKQEINFAAEGFNHLVFKGSRSERDKSTQLLRFRLLPLAVKLLGLSTTYQEYEESLKEFEMMSYKQRLRKIKLVKYWGIIAIIDGRKIKVIVRKIGDNGMPHFWSVIPAWVTNQYRDTRFFTTMKGNPDED